MTTFAAVDLGASSGRVITGVVRDGQIETQEVARFSNGPVPVPEPGGQTLRWPILHLWDSALKGLRSLGDEPIESIGVDTWAVDYGLMRAGSLIGLPYSYRDPRTKGVPEQFFAANPAPEIYRLNGLQNIELNTVFQIYAAAKAEGRTDLEAADSLLLLPDLFNYWLSGAVSAEITNASSTGLVDPAQRAWSDKMLRIFEQQTGLDLTAKLPAIVEPGTAVGRVRDDLLWLKDSRGEASTVVSVGSHDTASAVVAVPAQTPNFAYISAGTWSLVGLELDHPILSEAAREANFTNELGVDGTVRFLRNIMGMWIFNGCVRQWRRDRPKLSFAEVDELAAKAPALRTVIDVNDPVFADPGDMLARIDHLADQTGQPRPRNVGEYARCVYESLAIEHSRALRQAASVAGADVDAVHIVGGGSRNELLCQFTADASGLPVTAGPVEATALGNLLVQARAAGAVGESLADIRQVVRASTEVKTYQPAGDRSAWQAAEQRIR